MSILSYNSIPLKLGRDLINIASPISLNFAGKESLYCTQVWPGVSRPISLFLDGSTTFRSGETVDTSALGKSMAYTTPYYMPGVVYFSNEHEDSFNLTFSEKDAITSLTFYSYKYKDGPIDIQAPYLNYPFLQKCLTSPTYLKFLPFRLLILM